MTGLGRRRRSATADVCTEEGCDMPHYAMDLCQSHYRSARYRSSAGGGAANLTLPRPPAAPPLCLRCTSQVQSLPTDSGPGDRVTYFKSLTDAQRAAYVQGHGDGRRGGRAAR